MDEKPQNYWQSDKDVPSTSQPTATPAASDTDEYIEEVSWQASEYIHHDKGFVWYAVLSIVTIIGTGLAIFLQQWIFAALVLVMGIALGVYAKRPPREVNYVIADDGIHIDNQTFPYSDFRSFGILDDGAFFSLQLRPIKRFMPAVTMYFAEPDGERIVDALSERLPMEELNADFVDKLMRWLRF